MIHHPRDGFDISDEIPKMLQWILGSELKTTYPQTQEPTSSIHGDGLRAHILHLQMGWLGSELQSSISRRVGSD